MENCLSCHSGRMVQAVNLMLNANVGSNPTSNANAGYSIGNWTVS